MLRCSISSVMTYCFVSTGLRCVDLFLIYWAINSSCGKPTSAYCRSKWDESWRSTAQKRSMRLNGDTHSCHPACGKPTARGRWCKMHDEQQELLLRARRPQNDRIRVSCLGSDPIRSIESNCRLHIAPPKIQIITRWQSNSCGAR